MDTNYETGQEVTVIDHGHRYDGEIVKVGRTLVDIRYHGRVIQFRQDRKTATVRQTGAGIYFSTREDDARQERMRAADKTLAAHGVELSPRRIFTLEQAEALAEVVRTWDGEG